MEALAYKKIHAGGLDNPRSKTPPYVQGVLRKVCKERGKGTCKYRRSQSDVNSESENSGSSWSSSDTTTSSSRRSIDFQKYSQRPSAGSSHQDADIDNEEAFILFDLALHTLLKSTTLPVQLSRIVCNSKRYSGGLMTANKRKIL